MGNGRLRSWADGLPGSRRNLTLLSAVVSSAKKRLIIISAGAFGREVCDVARDIAASKGDKCTWEFVGFLDDRKSILKGKNAAEAAILGAPADYQPQENDIFICAIGDPKVRREYADMVRAKGGKFATLIEPWSRVGRSAEIGDGCFIGPFCAVSCDLNIGADTVITAHVTIGHDVTIGRSCHIGAYAFIGGGAVLGDEVTVHPHAVILPRMTVGDQCVVGAGSVVIGETASGTTVFGMPAKTIAR